MDEDFLLAVKLQEEFNAEHPGKKSQNPQLKKRGKNCLIDPEWELVDPNPDIHILFQNFDSKFFWRSLGGVEVKWSPRMYSCAGICTYKGKGGCTISLSLPLLKLRPRKDLIETLLHEMIHAYLFVTNNWRDRSDHGPKFHEHMNRINADAGTSISVYHTFNDEVQFYLTHWWRCNGPCQRKAPYFGLVKRSSNRPPGPNDHWFENHRLNCGGAFIKVKEPDGFKPRKRKGASDDPTTQAPNRMEKMKDLTHYFPNSNTGVINRSPVKNVTSTKKPTKKTVSSIERPTTGSQPSRVGESRKNSTSSGVGGNVVGFSDLSNGNRSGRPGGMGLISNRGGTLVERPKMVSRTNSSETKTQNESTVLASTSSQKKTGTGANLSALSTKPFPGTGYVLGSGKSTGIPDRSKSSLLNLYAPQKAPVVAKGGGMSKNEQSYGATGWFPKNEGKSHSSPKKEIVQPKSEMETMYLDDTDKLFSHIEADKDRYVNCPVCSKHIRTDYINDHLDSCVQLEDNFNESVIILGDDESEEVEDQLVCPCCQKICSNNEEMNSHLNECLGTVSDDEEWDISEVPLS